MAFEQAATAFLKEYFKNHDYRNITMRMLLNVFQTQENLTSLSNMETSAFRKLVLGYIAEVSAVGSADEDAKSAAKKSEGTTNEGLTETSSSEFSVSHKMTSCKSKTSTITSDDESDGDLSGVAKPELISKESNQTLCKLDEADKSIKIEEMSDVENESDISLKTPLNLKSEQDDSSSSDGNLIIDEEETRKNVTKHATVSVNKSQASTDSEEYFEKSKFYSKTSKQSKKSKHHSKYHDCHDDNITVEAQQVKTEMTRKKATLHSSDSEISSEEISFQSKKRRTCSLNSTVACKKRNWEHERDSSSDENSTEGKHQRYKKNANDEKQHRHPTNYQQSSDSELSDQAIKKEKKSNSECFMENKSSVSSKLKGMPKKNDRKHSFEQDETSTKNSKRLKKEPEQHSDESDDEVCSVKKKRNISNLDSSSSDDEPLMKKRQKIQDFECKSSNESSDEHGNSKSDAEKRHQKSSTKSSADEALQRKRLEEGDPKIERYKRYIRTAGIHVRYVDLFNKCKSRNAKINKILELLKDAGLKGQPSLESCKRLKKKREKQKELQELDTNNIIEAGGRTRSTRGSKPVKSAAVSETPPNKKLFSRLKAIVDSDESD